MRPDAHERAMTTPVQRLRQALELHAAGVSLKRLQLQRQFGVEEAERKLQAWLLEADGELPGFEPATLRFQAKERGESTTQRVPT